MFCPLSYVSSPDNVLATHNTLSCHLRQSTSYQSIHYNWNEISKLGQHHVLLKLFRIVIQKPELK